MDISVNVRQSPSEARKDFDSLNRTYMDYILYCCSFFYGLSVYKTFLYVNKQFFHGLFISTSLSDNRQQIQPIEFCLTLQQPINEILQLFEDSRRKNVMIVILQWETDDYASPDSAAESAFSILSTMAITRSELVSVFTKVEMHCLLYCCECEQHTLPNMHEQAFPPDIFVLFLNLLLKNQWILFLLEVLSAVLFSRIVWLMGANVKTIICFFALSTGLEAWVGVIANKLWLA